MPSLRPVAIVALFLGLGGLAALPFLAEEPSAPEAPAPEAATAKPIKQPNEYFHFQRASPNHDLPEGVYARALEQARAMPALAPLDRSAAVWQQAGPTNVGGRITAIAVDPNDDSQYWIGTADGGVLRTTDAGVTWTPQLDSFGGLSVGALVHHPTQSGTLLCGTGEANASGDSYDGIGILKTTDGGDTWVVAGLPNSQRVGKMAWDQTNPNVIHAAVSGGLFSTGPDRGMYRSTDGGDSWTQTLHIADDVSAIDVSIDPTDGDRVYAAMWERLRGPNNRKVAGPNSGIWRSTDGGATWSEMTNGVPTGSDVARIGLAVAPSNPSWIYAVYSEFSTSSGTTLEGVYRSTDGGSSWSARSASSLGNPFSSFGWYFGQIRVSPQDENEIWVLGVPLERSTNGGSSFSDRTNGQHVDMHELWINPANDSHVISGNDGGIFTTTNSGSSWSKSLNLPITQFYAITVDPQLPQRVYGGTQDNSTPRTLTGAIDDWDTLIGGDGFTVVVDPTNSNIIYGEYQYGGLSKSTDGFSFSVIFYGAGDGRANWHMPFVMDPSDRQTLYAGTYRVHRTTNGGGSFTPISPDLTDGPGSGNLTFGTLTALAVSATDPDVLYAGADDGNVHRTTNGGSSWTDVGGTLPDRWVTRLTIDPTDASVAYAAFSGYRSDDFTPYLYRTSDYGSSWADITGNLPQAPVNDVVVDPQNPSRLFVGGDVGVYVSNDLGVSWAKLGAGLPLSVVVDLELHEPTRALIAGTHGRSSFRLDLDEAVDAPEIAAGDAAGVRLAPPTPNPSRGASRLSFAVPRATNARLTLHDVHGRQVRTLFEGDIAAGPTDVTWDGRDDGGRLVAAGVYFARLEAAGEVRTMKVTRTR